MEKKIFEIFYYSPFDLKNMSPKYKKNWQKKYWKSIRALPLFGQLLFYNSVLFNLKDGCNDFIFFMSKCNQKSNRRNLSN